MKKLYIGVMSGTSLDGVDVVSCVIDKETCKLLHSYEYDFDKGLKSDILLTINGETTLKTIGEIDTRLGYLYAKCINDFTQKFDIKKEDIEAVGVHGQTLWHEPNSKTPFSMQLGNASVVQVQTGLKIVSDFRQKDIALGGQGAPFAPAFHEFLFSSLKKSVAVLNIGGMANITLISDKLQGYDTGCGNVLLDFWINKNKNSAYDKDGVWAKSGEINNELLADILAESFFKRNAPKSTGRELFNETWLDKYLQNYQDLKAEDVQATLLALTVKSIANEVKKTKIDLLIVCGGGVKNKELMRSLSEELVTVKVVPSDEVGVSSDFMEAMAFSWLGYKRVKKEKVNLSSVTGAKQNTILGCIYE